MNIVRYKEPHVHCYLLRLVLALEMVADGTIGLFSFGFVNGGLGLRAAKTLAKARLYSQS